jgi:hypothetical protein
MALHPFALTERDVAILASLTEVRHLTVQHIQWLHWHARWRTHEQAAREAGTVNHQPKKAYERLAALSERGLVITFTRSADRATTLYRRLPNSFSLTRDGAELLACRRGLLLEQLWYYRRVGASASTLEHSVAIGAFYAALRAELEYRGRQLSDWAPDSVLCTDYDSVALPSVIHPLPIIPDGTFTLDGERYMLEVDRGTTRIEQWRKKALAYQAYRRDPRLRERYGVSTFTVLVVAPSGERLQAIARTVAGVYNAVPSNYLFLAEERVHPMSIRRRWQRVEAVSWVPVRRGGKSALEPALTFRDDVLWTPQPEERRV